MLLNLFKIIIINFFREKVYENGFLLLLLLLLLLHQNLSKLLIIYQSPKRELVLLPFPPPLSLFTHGPWRWNRGSTDGFFLLLRLLLLLHTTKFVFLLGTENTNFQTGLTFQTTPVTHISSCSFYFLECFCLENCPLLSGELSTDSRQSSDSYCSSVQSSPGLDI